MTKNLSTIFGAIVLLCSGQALASFHFMQIQQAIGGVDGDTSVQAVQLRMRAGGQSQINNTVIRAYDAAGANPVDIIVFNANVSTANLGSTILVATAEFQAQTGLTADYTMSNPIPASYLPAGRLTFGSGATIYWSLAWGDSAYTGSTTGSPTNDADGNFGPPFAGALPSESTSALLFTGAAGALSTTNAADYAVTAGAATFTNNDGESAVVGPAGVILTDGFEELVP